MALIVTSMQWKPFASWYHPSWLIEYSYPQWKLSDSPYAYSYIYICKFVVKSSYFNKQCYWYIRICDYMVKCTYYMLIRHSMFSHIGHRHFVRQVNVKVRLWKYDYVSVIIIMIADHFRRVLLFHWGQIWRPRLGVHPYSSRRWIDFADVRIN